jgi:hypothetical protein
LDKTSKERFLKERPRPKQTNETKTLEKKTTFLQLNNVRLSAVVVLENNWFKLFYIERKLFYKYIFGVPHLATFIFNFSLM